VREKESTVAGAHLTFHFHPTPPHTGTMPSSAPSSSSWLGRRSSSSYTACCLFLALLLLLPSAAGFYLLPLRTSSRSSSSSSSISKTCRQATAASTIPPLPRNLTDGAAALPPTPSTFEVVAPTPSSLPSPSSTSTSTSASAYEQARQAPGPRRWPIVGNMLKVLRLGGIDKFDQLMYGTSSLLTSLPPPLPPFLVLVLMGNMLKVLRLGEIDKLDQLVLVRVWVGVPPLPPSLPLPPWPLLTSKPYKPRPRAGGLSWETC